MNLEKVQGIPGAVILTPTVHTDERGEFMEVFRENVLGAPFVQANHSRSKKGVLRGLHYHRYQADAWYVIKGDLQAVMVDLRVRGDRPKVAEVVLTAGKPQVLYIPPGVAHGFLALEDVELLYWVTAYYDASDEYGIAWDEPTIQAPWRSKSPVLSDRDKNNPGLQWESVPTFS